MNDLNSSQPIDFVNVYKHFELREIMEKTQNTQLTEPNQLAEQIDVKQIDTMISTLPLINDNIRTNIKLGIEIYKQLNNFDSNYIHSIINDKSISSKK